MFSNSSNRHVRSNTRLPEKGMKQLALVLFITVLLCGLLRADQWTRFRGPNGQGHSPATNLPTSWNPEDYRWTTTLPGPGHSSPVIWGDKLFITCCDPETPSGTILALSTSTGEILWQKTYPLEKAQMNTLNSYASTSPVVDKDGVYVIWPTVNDTIVVALDHVGNEIWKETFGETVCKHGPSVSPMLFDGLVIFSHEQEANDRGLNSRWLALDCKTGQIRWDTPRNNERLSYSTPCVYTDTVGKKQLIFSGHAHGISGVDPKTGTVLWDAGNFTARTVASPVVGESIVVATCGAGGSGKVLEAVKPGLEGRPAEKLYTIEDRTVPFVPTPLLAGKRLYTFHDGGTVVCRNVETGDVLWSEKPGGKFYGSPVCANGVIYCINTDGEVIVLKEAAEYQKLATVPLGEKSQATPAVADGVMYLRTLTKVMALGPVSK